MKKGFTLKGFTLIKVLVVIAILGILAAIILGSISSKNVAHADTNDNCGGWFQPSCDSATVQAQSQKETANQTLARLIQQVPAPRLDNSLERLNISKRLSIWSDSAKISYIYLINYGHVMAFYVVKGKVTSSNKRLTPSQQDVDTGWNSASLSNVVMEAPELDGTYGASSPYTFFWTTDSVYVQWSGDYMLTDQPLKLTNSPELIREVK